MVVTCQHSTGKGHRGVMVRVRGPVLVLTKIERRVCVSGQLLVLKRETSVSHPSVMETKT